MNEWGKNTENQYKKAGAYLEYGSLLIKLEKKDRALEFYKEGQQIYIRNYGKRHPFTSNSYLTLGDFYLQSNKIELALINYQKSIIQIQSSLVINRFYRYLI
ncbi:MAG: tetratricopeptide repeat protein [Chloroflexia bacterium]|nr:tetratricopeptide repeat protein [Chloroflexia bacterium]